MPRKLRELRRDLSDAGFYVDRQKGNHEVWLHERAQGARAVLAGPDSKDAHAYEEKEVREALRKLREALQRVERGKQEEEA